MKWRNVLVLVLRRCNVGIKMAFLLLNEILTTDVTIRKINILNTLANLILTIKKIVAYARVSNNSQKDNLKNQITFIRNYVNAQGEILDDVIQDIGSGLNYNRKHWNDLLLNQIPKGNIKKIYITYKDRFVRFGFDWFECFCNHYDCKIIVINNPDTSPQRELIDDLISIIHVFSYRIYGLRKYKKDICLDENLQNGNLSDETTRTSNTSDVR